MCRATILSLALATVLLAAGCATPAREQAMVIPAGSAVPEVDFPLRQTVGIIVAEGGKPTVPFFIPEIGNTEFTAALRRSLAAGGLWTDDPSRTRYALHAILVSHDEPVRGFDKTVQTVVRYRLRNLQTQRVVFDEKIETSDTVTFSTQPLAMARQREAAEGAVRKNFAALIRRLRAFQP